MSIRQQEYEKINELRQKFIKRYYVVDDNPIINNSINLPFRIKSIILDAYNIFPGTEPKITDKEIFTIVDKFCNDLPYLYGNINNKDIKIYNIRKYACQPCEYAIRENLTSKKLSGKINSKSLNYIIECVKQKFIDGVIDGGEMIGETSSFIASEPIQQATLNTFHTAGSKKSLHNVSGIKLINNIFNVSKNPINETMIIYLDPKHNTFSDAKKVVDQIGTVKISDLIEESMIYIDKDANKITETGLKDDIEFINDFVEYNTSKIPHQDLSSVFVRIKLDSNIMFKQNVFIETVVNAINNTYKSVFCVHSDNNYKSHIIRIYALISRLKTDKKETEHGKCSEIHDTIGNIIVRGTPGINGISIQTKESIRLRTDGSPEKFDEYYIITSGSNFHEICRDVNYIDQYRLWSNNILEMKQELGYEAARYVVMKELLQIYKDIGANINEKHIILIVDYMTHNHNFVPITRHGMTSTTYLSPFQKLSFEIPVRAINNFSIESISENSNGIEVSKLLNKPFFGGTGASELILDTSKIEPDKKSSDDDIIKNLGW